MKLLPELSGRYSDSLLKSTGEMIQIGVSYHFRDNTDWKHGRKQQMLGFADPAVDKIVNWRNTDLQLYNVAEIV